MGHACTHDDFPHRPEPEHPVTAVVAVIAILAAILLIAWVRLEVHGVADLAALADEDGARSTMSNRGAPEDEAASSRWATGFSH